MTRIKKVSRTTILKSSEVRRLRHITPQDIKGIMLKVAEAVRTPNAFTNEAVSIDIDGKSCDVFSPKAAQRDLLGWILVLSYQHWTQMRSGRKDIGDVVSMYIDSHIRTISHNKLRLMSLGDTDPMFASQYLNEAAERLDSDHLPKLFRYAMDWESEEDKQKRLAKAAARRAKLDTNPQLLETP